MDQEEEEHRARKAVLVRLVEVERLVDERTSDEGEFVRQDARVSQQQLVYRTLLPSICHESQCIFLLVPEALHQHRMRVVLFEAWFEALWQLLDVRVTGLFELLPHQLLLLVLVSNLPWASCFDR